MATPSARKLAGALAVLLFVVLYTLLAMWFGAVVVNSQAKWLQLLYYAVAGVGWALPAIAIIRWANKPAK